MNLPKPFIILFCTLGLLINASLSQAVELSLGLNVSRNELTVLESKGAGRTVAMLNDNLNVLPALAANFSEFYFGNTRFGVLIELNIGAINMHYQMIDGKAENIGTNIRGVFGHFNPVVFYRLGSRYKGDARSWTLTGGLGYGLSYLQLDGDLRTSSLPEDEQSDLEVKNTSGVFLLPAALLEFTWHDWFVRISSCFGGGGLEDSGYNYQLRFRSAAIGYSFTL